jgi:hypothetical protein
MRFLTSRKIYLLQDHDCSVRNDEETFSSYEIHHSPFTIRYSYRNASIGSSLDAVSAG